jgi:hypothetical protein
MREEVEVRKTEIMPSDELVCASRAVWSWCSIPTSLVHAAVSDQAMRYGIRARYRLGTKASSSGFRRRVPAFGSPTIQQALASQIFLSTTAAASPRLPSSVCR